MSQKTEKKFRKTIRKKTDDLSRGIMGRAAFTIARQRDIIFLIACSEFIIIILLLIWRIFF